MQGAGKEGASREQVSPQLGSSWHWESRIRSWPLLLPVPREPPASKEPSRRDHGEVTLARPSQLPGQRSLCKTLAQQLPGAAASGRAEFVLYK